MSNVLIYFDDMCRCRMGTYVRTARQTSVRANVETASVRVRRHVEEGKNPATIGLVISDNCCCSNFLFQCFCELSRLLLACMGCGESVFKIIVSTTE